ncbi:DUF1349 domain-containing protein [Arthrobacter sp. ISL-48]|uniref:DUF1349 domain-containing protein n=1 Tax=Arthrobacter sp. ISL-48 TaxID=2819110 RepID=UPI001BEC521C|nr:DUF1349 domain-containing protein [Arthrobacter sp. ISL-48]
MMMLENMIWLNEPAQWENNPNELTVVSDHDTDFWRETFYGFTHDTGHFLHREVVGDFTATVKLSGDFTTLYDQAGLMVRANKRAWMKTGVEYTDEALHLSTVITHGASDWSIMSLPNTPDEITMQVTRQGNALRAQYLHPQGTVGQWRMLRLGHLPLEDSCQVGMMMCSPKRGGLRARFRDFSITPSQRIDLHPHQKH